MHGSQRLVADTPEAYRQVPWQLGECRKHRDLDWAPNECWSQRAVEDIREEVSELRSVCEQCPILAECRAYAVEHNEYGFWGGMTWRERDALRRGQPLVRRAS